MRTSASKGWVTRNRNQVSDRRQPVVRFARADFEHFEALPEGFRRFSSLSDQVDAPDPDLLRKARQELEKARGVSGLAGLRLAKGISQKELAESIGTSQPRLSTWENGSEKPGFESLKRLREALAVSFDDIMEALDA